MSVLPETIIDSKYQGERLDKTLAFMFPDYSRAQLVQWLKEGYIRLEGCPQRPKDKVKGGEHVFFTVPENLPSLNLKPEAMSLAIIFEDEDCLVINKPAGLVVHPGAGNTEHTLVNALLHHAPALAQLPRAGLIHRLDKETTGLLVIAKTIEAHTSLTRQMQARTIERRYHALVYGTLHAAQRIETGFGRDRKNRLKMAVMQSEKKAITLFKVKQHFQGTTLLDIQLMTGRTHQIRVHMAYIKHPIVGDPLYGGRQRHLSTRFKRQALHAYSLAFDHPKHQQRLAFEAPIPDDFKTLLVSLET